MSFTARELSVLAYANGFTLWHYRTGADDLLGAGYFDSAQELLREGDQIIAPRHPQSRGDPRRRLRCRRRPRRRLNRPRRRSTPTHGRILMALLDLLLGSSGDDNIEGFLSPFFGAQPNDRF